MTHVTIEETATAAAQDARPPDDAWTLFLDLATMTGWAVGRKASDKSVTFMSGRWDLRPTRYESAAMRFIRLLDELDNIRQAVPIGMVAFEEVRAHKGVDAAHIYGGLMASLQTWCEQHKIPYTAVGVAAIKKHATGKGNATKEAMVEAVERKWCPHVTDHNEADAVAGLHLVLGVA